MAGQTKKPGRSPEAAKRKPPAGKPNAPKLKSPERRLTLLVVDDERPVIAAIRKAFMPYKDQVDLGTTTSGVEALLLVSEMRPDGVVVDAVMPDIDGLEVCRRIRARRQMDKIRIFIMDKDVPPELEQASKQAGAVMCLRKPVDVNLLLELMRR